MDAGTNQPVQLLLPTSPVGCGRIDKKIRLASTAPIGEVGSSFLIDSDDFNEVIKHRWYAHQNGSKTNWYIRGKVYGKYVYLHRFILGLSKNDPQVDHINGNGFDNRKSNLRLATNSQNQCNSKSRFGTSKYRGVYWNKARKKWHATIRKNSHQTHLGYFDDQRVAAKAYNKAAKKLHGQFAKLNNV